MKDWSVAVGRGVVLKRVLAAVGWDAGVWK